MECADYIVLNKTDLCPEDRVENLKGIVASLNPTAKESDKCSRSRLHQIFVVRISFVACAQILPSSWGKIPIESVLGPPLSSNWVRHCIIF